MNKILLPLAILLLPIFAFAQTGGDVPIDIKFYQLHGRSSGVSLMGNTFFEIRYKIENKKSDTLRNGQFKWRILPALSSDYMEVLKPSSASIRDSSGVTILDFQDEIIAPGQFYEIEVKVDLSKMVRKNTLESDYVFRNQFFQFNTAQGDLVEPDSLWPQVLGTYINYGNSNLELKQDDFITSEIDPSKPLTVDFSFRNRSGYDFDTLKLNLDVVSDVPLKNVELGSTTDSLGLQWNNEEITIFRSNLNNSGNDFFDIELILDFEEGEVQDDAQFELSMNGYTADYQFFHPFNGNQIQLEFLDKISSSTDLVSDAIQLSYAPNPSTSAINFSVKNASYSNFQLEVFDVIGKRKLSKRVSNNFRLEKSELGNGIWFFHLKKDGKIIETGKVVFIEN